MIYKVIPSYPDYVASSDGKIYSLKRGKRIEMRTSPNADGYLRCNISMRGVIVKLGIHILVCEAFHGRRPAGNQCRHLNGIRDDNRPRNLKWGTAQENCDDRSKHGFWKSPSGERHPQAKVSDAQVAEMIHQFQTGTPQADLVRQYGLSRAQVCRIVRGRQRRPAVA